MDNVIKEQELIRKDDNQKVVKQQSKVTFNGIHKNSTNYDCYTFKPNKIHMGKPICLRFAVLDLRRRHMYESNHDKS